ncbi:MAG: hypothetical protein NWP83_05105, partial [Spirosomaceae bacterium]|nr:hypothetical protein [Spirosomataceae bacterium]
MSNKNPFTNFKTSTENLFLIFFLVLIGSYLLTTSYFWWAGSTNIINWNVISSLEESASNVAFTTDDGILLQIIEPLFYVKEKYVPTGSIVSSNLALIYLIGVIIGVSLVLSATLRLKSVWFMFGIAVLGIIISSFNLELVFAQLTKTAFLISFFGIALVAYLYNSWVSKNGITRTFPVFLLAFGAFCLILQIYGKAPLPFLSITNSSVAVGLLLSCVFIFFIAHEIVALILKVVTSSGLGGKNSVGQFAVASGIYLLNTLLIYFENANRFEASSVIIDPWWLFCISVIAGFWGFRNYCNQTETMSFTQSGVWLYLGGAFVTLATVSYIYATDNNPLIELLADFIAISHLVVGIVFFGHVLINFIQPLKQNLAVHKILYKTPFSRLILARTVAVFGIFILFAFKNYYSFNQFMAGYYNSLGDYSLATNDLFVAESYYKKSVTYDQFNHKGNYTLASLAQSQGDFTTAGFYFKNALEKQPSSFAYAGLSESLLQANLYFDATFTLKNGVNAFPTDNHLATNLSQQYDKSSIVDSTFLYANTAYNNCGKCDVEAANLLAFWLENAKIDRLDSISAVFVKQSNSSVLANKAAIVKKQGKAISEINLNLGRDSVLSVSQFALLHNFITNPSNNSIIDDIDLGTIQNKVENTGYFSDLLFIRAKNNYFNGDKTKGFQQIGYLSRDETADTKLYDLTSAGWYLNEGLYNKSLDAFYKAGDSLSIQNLQLADYKSKITDRQLAYSNNIPNESISMSKYEAVLQKAPYNPFVVERVVDMLVSVNKSQKAYEVAFNAVQENAESVILWKKYTLISLKNGLISYAENGLNNVQR